MELTCSRCGIRQEDIPATFITPPVTEDNPDPEQIEVHRFELYDAQRDLYICKPCLPVYNELEPKAMEYPHLVNMPKARKALVAQVPSDDMEFFRLLLPGQVF